MIRVPWAKWISRYLPRRPVCEDALAGQQLRQGRGERPAQAVAAQQHAVDQPAFEVGRDAEPGDFNFWQFWHISFAISSTIPVADAHATERLGVESEIIRIILELP